MNLFNFVVSDAIVGLILFFVYGLFFGLVILGLARYLIFGAAERHES